MDKRRALIVRTVGIGRKKNNPLQPIESQGIQIIIRKWLQVHILNSQTSFIITIVQFTPVCLIFSTMVKGIAKCKHKHIAIILDISNSSAYIILTICSILIVKSLWIAQK